MKRDFEEESTIRICCTWGEDLEDGILRFYIDNDDSSKVQEEAVRNAVKEWDVKFEPLELEEVSSRKNSDIRIEFRDGNDDEGEEREDIAGQTTTIYDEYGFISSAKVTINKSVRAYAFDTTTIEQVAKHEMGHALGLGHANFDGKLMTEMVKDGTEAISKCKINAVVAPNYWKLGKDNNDGISNPDYPQSDSITC